ncbi:hypothetical protein Ancab_018800 [Ancistrocladus abbreviatus]
MMNECNIDKGSYMLKQLVSVNKTKIGIIVVGGLITPIGLALGYDVASLKEARRSIKIDIESCITMKMIVKVSDVYFLMFKDHDTTHSFPDPNQTTIRNRANWSFPMVGDQPQPPLLEPPLGNFERSTPS